MSFGGGTTDSIRSLPLLVVDASVATKWYLRDEPDVDDADRVLDDFQQGRTYLAAPTQIRYEVPSAVRNAVRIGRQTPADGRATITDFLALPLDAVDNNDLIEAGYDQAMRFGCSFYDGLYLALAETLDCPFVFADLRLRNALGAKFPRALWLTDYVPAG